MVGPRQHGAERGSWYIRSRDRSGDPLDVGAIREASGDERHDCRGARLCRLCASAWDVWDGVGTGAVEVGWAVRPHKSGAMG